MPSDTSRPLLAVSNIEVIYDHVILVLRGVSLAVGKGGVVAESTRGPTARWAGTWARTGSHY